MEQLQRSYYETLLERLGSDADYSDNGTADSLHINIQIFYNQNPQFEHSVKIILSLYATKIKHITLQCFLTLSDCNMPGEAGTSASIKILMLLIIMVCKECGYAVSRLLSSS